MLGDSGTAHLKRLGELCDRRLAEGQACQDRAGAMHRLLVDPHRRHVQAKRRSETREETPIGLPDESALALAFDREKLSDLHGVLTPAAAMGEALLARFPASGVSLRTERLG